MRACTQVEIALLYSTTYTKYYFLDDLLFIIYITVLETQCGPVVLTFLSVWPLFRLYTAQYKI